MKKRYLPTFLIMLILGIILGGIFCSKRLVKQTTNFKISDTKERIVINGNKYRLSITKLDGIVTLYNSHGVRYSSFPLQAQFNNNFNSPLKIDWQVKSKEITMLLKKGESDQKVIIRPFANAIEIRFGIDRIYADSGVYVFKQGQSGFDTEAFEAIFSPEPDDFYSSTPQIDVRVNRDQQWAFTPAPLNLSFKTQAGWFSIGLTKLPNASIFAFRDNAIYLDHRFIKSSDICYWLPPLVFTFNESPWEAVGDYRSYLIDHNYISTDEKQTKNQPSWWTHPLVSTWGEQMIQNLIYDSLGYNSNWIRNYVLNQEVALDSVPFNLIIEDKWTQAYGDPNPSSQFKDLHELIDWCHERGHKVLLSWRAWKIEANSLAARLNIGDGEYIDATHPLFEAYIDTCCQILFGNSENQLNADGIKIDNLFLVRDPSSANYANPSLGMGMSELYHYLKIFYKYAKKYKSDCLISSSAIDPHYEDVQDMVRINSDWDNKLRREKRARIIIQALPDILIDGDAADMYNNIALYHYVTSAIYGIPSVQYLSQFHDGEISHETKHIVTNILKLSSKKPVGKLEFVKYGNWRIVKEDNILAESLPHGKGIVIYSDDQQGILLCAENTNVHLILNKKLLKTVTDQDGNRIEFKHLGQGIYELGNVQQGKIYTLSLRKISNIYE